MQHTEMLAAHPDATTAGYAEVLAACLAACFDCARTCATCADACLSEETVGELTDCVRLDLDCADICHSTARLLSRHIGGDTSLVRAFVDTSLVACRACAEECEKHASMHEHCRLCAEECRRCAAACEALLVAL